MSEIVMAAMNGPGAPKIPAPQINFPARSASDDSELPWPRMNKSEVQNYTTIFMDIDTNRDGSITRDEAHKNFSNGGYQELCILAFTVWTTSRDARFPDDVNCHSFETTNAGRRVY
ncbi:hypothetical protein ACFX14_034591 [Malus domestica]